MKTCLVGSCDCPGLSVQYFLLITEENDIGHYGIAVADEEEQITISDITPSLPKVQELLDLLIRGKVTPVTVRDVVDDWLLQ